MLGFNWIDLLIVGLLVALAIQGARLGLLTQLFGIAGFFGMLFLAGWLFPHLLPLHDRTLKTMLNTVCVLLAALYAGIRAADLGQSIHWSFRIGRLIKDRKLKHAETISGSLPSLLAGLALIWLLGVAISRLPFAGFSNSVNDSQIMQLLTRSLPPVPAVFAEFDKQIDPNSPPPIAAQPKPAASFNYSAEEVQSAASKAANSIVRITSFGCGGLVSGSGFVIAPNLIATNAHVIAGVQRPIVKYSGQSYEATPILFDAGLDLAILRTRQLRAPALPLDSQALSSNTSVAVLGYPGGNYTVSPGIIREQLVIKTPNIYDVGAFNKAVYGLQASVSTGSSGGPAVTKDGQAVGIIFSKSTDTPDYAYALPAKYLTQNLSKAKASYRHVNTGACTLRQ